MPNIAHIAFLVFSCVWLLCIVSPLPVGYYQQNPVRLDEGFSHREKHCVCFCQVPQGDFQAGPPFKLKSLLWGYLTTEVVEIQILNPHEDRLWLHVLRRDLSQGRRASLFSSWASKWIFFPGPTFHWACSPSTHSGLLGSVSPKSYAMWAKSLSPSASLNQSPFLREGTSNLSYSPRVDQMWVPFFLVKLIYTSKDVC